MAYLLRSGTRRRVSDAPPDPALLPPTQTPEEEEKIQESSVTEEEEEFPSGGPLQHEYILAELMSYLSFEDLKSCRGVNGFWNQVATRVIAPKTAVIQVTHVNLHRLEKLGRLMETLQGSWNFPCKKFDVSTPLAYHDTTPEEKLLLPRFFEKVAPFATHLEINCRSASRLFRWTKPPQNTEFSKLRSLQFSYQTLFEFSNKDRVLEKDVSFILSVLEHAPKLDTISLGTGTYWKGAFAILCRVFDRVPWKNISHLRLEGKPTGTEFQKLLDLGTALRLQIFELESCPPQNTSLVVCSLLERNRETLTTLKLHLDTCGEQGISNFSLPELPKLKTLKLNVCQLHRCQQMALLSLKSLSNWFPRLSSLHISGVQWHKFGNFFQDGGARPVETVQELWLDFYIDAWDYKRQATLMSETDATRVIQQLSPMFPRVRKLTIPPQRALLEAIDAIQAWKEVDDLTLLTTMGFDFDYQLTGLAFAKCWRGAWNVNEKVKIFQFLHQLKKLEVTTSRPESLSKEDSISDVSCLLVLLQLENLEWFSIRRLFKQHEVSQQMIDRMSEKFKVLYTQEDTPYFNSRDRTLLRY